MNRSYAPYPTSAQAGPSRPPTEPINNAPPPPSGLPHKPKKRRKLQFTSQIRTSIPRYNPDGTDNVEYLHQQSTQRLKRKWDSIFERFKDAHLQEQDEIYLGNRANGEPILVVKDRGSLRSLRQSMEFGVFIKDEELQGWKDRPEARQMQEQDDEDEEDIDPSRVRSHPAHLAGASSSESDDDQEDDLAANDPDLREFLEAEARRKAVLGKSGDDYADEEEDGDVIDFADPQSLISIGTPRLKPVTPILQRPDPPVVRSQPLTKTPDLVPSSSEDNDDDDSDIVTVHSDSDEELVDSIRTKRQIVEELLQCTTPFETLPYNDIFGLADLLKVTDNTSRLYIDLVSEDEDEGGPVRTETRTEIPAVEPIGDENVIDLTSSLPNSSLVADAASSPPPSDLSPPSQASSVVPVAPASERSMSPEDATIVEIAPVRGTPVKNTLVESAPLQTTPVEAPTPIKDVSIAVKVKRLEQSPGSRPAPLPSLSALTLQTSQPCQPEAATAVSSPVHTGSPLIEPTTLAEPAMPAIPPPPAAPTAPTTPADPSEQANLAKRERTATPASSELSDPPESPATAETSANPANPSPTPEARAQITPTTPHHVAPHREPQLSQPTPSHTYPRQSAPPASAAKTPTQSARSTTPLSASRRHHHSPTSSSHAKRTPSSAERQRQHQQPRRRRSDKAKPACGGPGKCTKTFCFSCG